MMNQPRPAIRDLLPSLEMLEPRLLMSGVPAVTIAVVDNLARETVVGQAPDCGKIHLTQSGDAPLAVHFTMAGTAQPGVDYILTYPGGKVITNNTVTVPAGSTGINVKVAPIDDSVARTVNLTATMQLAADVTYTLPPVGYRKAQVLIADNDIGKFGITTSAFTNGGVISDSAYTLTSPTFNWANAPAGTKSFAMIVETPCPVYKPFVQWVVYNISPEAMSLRSDNLPSGATQGVNSTGLPMWLGPMPPPGTEHFYYFRLYALNADLQLSSGLTRAQLLTAMSGHVLGTATIMATCGSGIPVYG